MKRLVFCLLSCALLATFSACAHSAQLSIHVSGSRADGRLPQRFAYNRQGCHGANQRPDVSWSGAPAATRSFAISVFDRDAGKHGFWHWMAVDLNAKVHAVQGNQPLPAPAHALRNDYGHAGWGGPCPPRGPAHHYVFTVYALDVTHVPLPPSTDPAQAARIIRKHALETAHVTLTYGR